MSARLFSSVKTIYYFRKGNIYNFPEFELLFQNWWPLSISGRHSEHASGATGDHC